MRMFYQINCRYAKVALAIFVLFTIFGCATVNSPEPYKRMKAFSKLRNQKQILQVASGATSQYTDVQIEAVKKLYLQNDLKLVYFLNHNAEVQDEAFKRITDQKVLYSIFQIKTISPELRMAIIGMISDQLILISIAHGTDYETASRIAALGKISDAEAVSNILARNISTPAFADYAVTSTYSSHILVELIAKIQDTSMQNKLLAKISDANEMVRLIKKPKIPNELRRIAIGYINDSAALMQIVAEFNNNQTLQELAIERVSDQQILGNFILTSQNNALKLKALERITDQETLEQFVLSSQYNNLKEKAIEQITNPDLLYRLVKSKEHEVVRLKALSKINNQDYLGELAAEITNITIRREIINKLTDHHVLKNIVSKEINTDFYTAVLDKLMRAGEPQQSIDQEIYKQIYERCPDEKNGIRALSRITDQKLLKDRVLKSKNKEIRIAALKNLNDKATITKLASYEKDWDVRCEAISKLPQGQEKLKEYALKNPAAAVRLAAISRIDDETFLYERSLKDASESVRLRAVEMITNKGLLLEVATMSYYDALRENAAKRCIQSDIELIKELIKSARKVIDLTTDQNLLSDHAINGKYDVLCYYAAKKITSQPALAEVAKKAADRIVTKIVLEKLTDEACLQDVSSNAKDKATRIAASVLCKKNTWSAVFKNAINKSADLNDAIAAISLVPQQKNISEIVTEACLSLIRKGDESRIPELVDLLDNYGYKALCEDYLNCGQPDLGKAGENWAYKHGYDIGSGYGGSSRANWGSRW